MTWILVPLLKSCLKHLGRFSGSGFKTENYVIPATSTMDAMRGLKGKVRDFCAKYDGDGSLLVVIYEGHSEFHPALGLQIL